MYKSIKFFNLMEESFLLLKKTNKKIWIIGIIISILSGGLIINETVGDDFYPESYDSMLYDDTLYPDMSSEEFMTFTDDISALPSFLGLIFVGLLLFLTICAVLGILISTVSYYLCKYIYEILYDKEIEKAPLGLVVKVNAIALFKTLLGLIFFIIPGIVIGLKYAPVNYILCKHPDISSKEILSKTREMSRGIKWKTFIFNLLLSIIGGILMLLSEPNTFDPGYITLDIISSIISFMTSTLFIVFSTLFSMKLFSCVDEIKNANIDSL